VKATAPRTVMMAHRRGLRYRPQTRTRGHALRAWARFLRDDAGEAGGA
jgi:hypothetical protein